MQSNEKQEVAISSLMQHVKYTKTEANGFCQHMTVDRVRGSGQCVEKEENGSLIKSSPVTVSAYRLPSDGSPESTIPLAYNNLQNWTIKIECQCARVCNDYVSTGIR